MSTEYKIEVMQAYLDGRPIEIKFKPNFGSNWEDLKCDPHWDWNNYDYRVKEEQWINIYKYNDGEELVGSHIFPSKMLAEEYAESHKGVNMEKITQCKLDY